MGPSLCRRLHSIGWQVTQFDVLRSDVSNWSLVFDTGNPDNAEILSLGVY